MTERGPRLPIGDADRIRSICDLSDLDGLNVRQPQNPVELQLQLVLIEIPEAFADAAEIASADFIEPGLDDADFAVVIEIELKPPSA